MRTHLCGVLRPDDVGTEGAAVRMGGPAARARRTLGLRRPARPRGHRAVRDRPGHVDVRSEWVIAVRGTVRQRPEGTGEPDLTPARSRSGTARGGVQRGRTAPFSVDDRAESDEPVRLRHRYVDLRRPRMQRNLRLRARGQHRLRAAMDATGLREVETPLLWAPPPRAPVSSPSGPACIRVFYALRRARSWPSSCSWSAASTGTSRLPAACGTRTCGPTGSSSSASSTSRLLRQPGRRDGRSLGGRARRRRGGHGERPPPIDRMTWGEALDRYGTDKPDLRFGMELIDLTPTFAAPTSRPSARRRSRPSSCPKALPPRSGSTS